MNKVHLQTIFKTVLKESIASWEFKKPVKGQRGTNSNCNSKFAKNLFSTLPCVRSYNIVYDARSSESSFRNIIEQLLWSPVWIQIFIFSLFQTIDGNFSIFTHKKDTREMRGKRKESNRKNVISTHQNH